MTSLSDLSTEQLLERRRQLTNEDENGNGLASLSTEDLKKKKARLERTTGEDVTRQAVIGGASGLAAAPRTAFEFGEFLTKLATDPRNTIREVAGFSPIEKKSLAENVLGKENADAIAESTGIKGLTDALDQGLNALSESRQQAEELGLTPFTKKGLPTSEEATESFFGQIGVDTEPTTGLGRIARAGTQRLGESALFGPVAAAELALGGTVGQTARELGAPEAVATTADIVSTIARPKITKATVGEKLKTISKKDVAEFSEKVEGLPGEITAFDSAKLAEEIGSEATTKVLNEIDPRGLSREEAAVSLKEAVQENSTVRRAETSNLYDELEVLTKDQPLPTTRAAERLSKVAEEIETIGLPAEASASVNNFLKREMEILSDPSVSASEKIRSKQRFNNFLDFEFPDPTKKTKAKSILNPVLKELRRDINSGLRSANKEAFVLFRKAENSHINNVKIFGKDAVQDLVNTQSPEKFAKKLKEPSTFDAVKGALTKPEDILSLERSALEETFLKPTTKDLRRETRDLRAKLNPRARGALDEILELNDPKSIANKSVAIQQKVVDELAETATSGGTPTTTLKLMHTPEGLELVEEALRKSRNGDKLLNELKEVFLKDLFKDIVTPEGLNLKKLGEISKDKNLKKSLEKIGGKDLSNFVEGMGVLKKKIDSSLLTLVKNAKKEIFTNPTKFGLGLGLLHTLGFSLGPLAGVAVTAKLSSNIVGRLMRNQTVRSLIKTIGAKPGSAKSALLRLNKEVEKELEE